MSIILKGIDLPKDDSFCMTVGITNAGSDITIFYKDITKGIEYRGIEAIQIPKEHGRLIDADALFQDLIEHNIPFNNDINSAINVAPTILEAEE